jgi:hypothetical protein
MVEICAVSSEISVAISVCRCSSFAAAYSRVSRSKTTVSSSKLGSWMLSMTPLVYASIVPAKVDVFK